MGLGRMTSEWDQTPWGGTAVMPVPTEPRGMHPNAATTGRKAEIGPGVGLIMRPDSVMSSLVTGSPLKVIRRAQQMYHENAWINSAERTVTRHVRSLPWHLEDTDDELIDDETADPVERAIQALMEKPQEALPPEKRQVGLTSRKNMWEITSRHMGICGVSYWFLDSLDQNGIPAAILYVNPARLWPFGGQHGTLIGYSLDPKDDYGRGGVLLRPEEIVPFYLEPPDSGFFPTGLVAVAALKAQITSMADRHTAGLLTSGGRTPGLISPKDGYINDPDQFEALVRDLRTAASGSPDGGLRDAILRGPVDFTKTGADPTELGLLDISKMNRGDIFTIWGFPETQAGTTGPTGMNSGDTRKFERQILMEGPVHDRVQVMVETIQYHLLDRWKLIGTEVELVVEEPSFDDDSAPYEQAAKAEKQPLTDNERRLILGLDPWPDYGPDGKPLGLAIRLPSGFTPVGQGPEENGKFDNAPEPEPEPEPLLLPPPPGALPAALPAVPRAPVPPARKASTGREAVLTKYEPQIRRAVAGVLAEQRDETAARLAGKSADQLRRFVRDSDALLPAKWDGRMLAALKSHLRGLVGAVTRSVQTRLGKADIDDLDDLILQALGERIKGINQTTRDLIAGLIGRAVDDGLTSQEITIAVREATAFDEARAEVIARTESGYAYNTSAVTSYREFGVERVEVIDGDEDDICAPLNGAIWTLDEAMAEPLGHPNCTRDFAPYLGNV